MYTRIINPATGRSVKVLGRNGINILKKYVEALHVMEGGMRGADDGAAATGDGAAATGDGAAATGDGAAETSAASKTDEVDPGPDDIYLSSLALLNKKLFEERPVCRKPGNEWTQPMLCALTDIMATKNSEKGDGDDGVPGSGGIFTDPSFCKTLLQLRLISRFDPTNPRQSRSHPSTRFRPRDIILPFGEWLRNLGEQLDKEEYNTELATAPTNVSQKLKIALNKVFPVMAEGDSDATFNAIMQCFPRKITGLGQSMGKNDMIDGLVPDYLPPRRLLFMTMAIKSLCDRKLPGKVFLNTLERRPRPLGVRDDSPHSAEWGRVGIDADESSTLSEKKEGISNTTGRLASNKIYEDDENVFKVFSGVDIEVGETSDSDIIGLLDSEKELLDVFGRKTKIKDHVASKFNVQNPDTSSENYYLWYGVEEEDLRRSARDGHDAWTLPRNQLNEVGAEGDPWADLLGETFRYKCKTHKILGFFKHTTKTKTSVKVVLIARDTYYKLFPTDPAAKFWFAEEAKYSTVTATTEAAATGEVPQLEHIILKMGRPGHYTIGLLNLNNNSILYFDSEGAIAYSSSKRRYPQRVCTKAGPDNKITVITPCPFPLQTDTEEAQYWEDGYCQTWVWFFIYNMLGLEPASSAANNASVVPAEVAAADVAKKWKEKIEVAVNEMVRLRREIAAYADDRTKTRSYYTIEKKLSLYKDSLKEIILGSNQALIRNLIGSEDVKEALGEDLFMALEGKKSKDESDGTDHSLGEAANDQPCEEDFSFLLNLYWTELLMLVRVAASGAATAVARQPYRDFLDNGSALPILDSPEHMAEYPKVSPLTNFLETIIETEGESYGHSLNDHYGPSMIKRSEIWDAMSDKYPKAFLLKKWTMEEEARKAAAAEDSSDSADE